MSKGLVEIRNGIDDVYRELIDANKGDALPVDEIMTVVKARLQSEIERFQLELVDATLGRLIHEVGRRKGGRSRNADFRDLFNGYKRIPQSVLIGKGRRKPTGQLSIGELKAYLEEHSHRSLNRHHEEFRRMIADCTEYVTSENDTLEVLLQKRADAVGRD